MFTGGAYDFYYASLVRNKNVRAASYLASYYNQAYSPTLFWDGGYRVDVGAGSVSGAEATYTTSTNLCGNRAVPGLDLNLSFTWLGNATMDIHVSVQNNDTSEYRGYIRVYVTEITSSMGWVDTQRKPYTFTFLDWAVRDSVFVDPGGVWQDSTIWDGHYHNDGLGNNFGSITMDNVAVLAAVFNPEWHLGYSDPGENQYPFDAYYVDEAAGAWIDVPPYMPSDSTPEDGAVYVYPDADLGWTGGDPQFFDNARYDVYFGSTTPPPLLSSGQPAATYNPGTMEFGTTYYWQIVARDNSDNSATGPVWSFTTAKRGDSDGDGEVALSDIVYLINYVLKNGAPPALYESGDVNCDVLVDIADGLYLINYVLKNGPEPC